MLLSGRSARRAVAGAIGAGAIAGAMLFGAHPVGARRSTAQLHGGRPGGRGVRRLGVDLWRICSPIPM